MSDGAALVRSYLHSFATGDVEAIAAHVTDDFVNEHTAALGSGCTGRAEYLSRLPGFLAGFPGLLYDVEQVVVQGDRAAAAYRMTASSDGHPVDLRGAMMFELAGGRIAKRTDYWDSLTYLRQVGQA